VYLAISSGWAEVINTSTLKIGVLGAARITPTALVRPAREIAGLELDAVAARDSRRAQAFAHKHGVSRVFGSYQTLLDDPCIDAIYNPLPNSLHFEWTIKALEAGKHVLCEKPFCSNANEARLMVQASQQAGLILMEAFHYRYHPLIERVRELVTRLGRVRHIETRFCHPLPRFNDIRFSYNLGGGANMDLGAYTSDMLRLLASATGDPEMAANPQVVRAKARLIRPDVDRTMEAELKWNNGCSGRIVNSLWSLHFPGSGLKVVGQRGQLKVLNPVFPHRWHRLRVTIDGKSHSEQVPGNSSYHYQLLEFQRRIHGQTASSDLQESITTMELIDAIYGAAGLPLRGIVP
jgi:predicted dehydrogenase